MSTYILPLQVIKHTYTYVIIEKNEDLEVEDNIREGNHE